MNGHAQGFCPVTQKLEPLFTASKTALKKCCFHCYGHTLGFLPQTQKNTLCSLNNTTGNCCSVTFIWMVTPKDFIHKLKRYKYLDT